MFLYRDDYYNPDSMKPGVAELMVAKNNDGPCGLVELAWMGNVKNMQILVSLQIHVINENKY